MRWQSTKKGHNRAGRIPTLPAALRNGVMLIGVVCMVFGYMVVIHRSGLHF